jgi:hypothetical protein
LLYPLPKPRRANKHWSLLTNTGVLMIASAPIGWYQFAPPTNHSYSWIYRGFISSPIGLGTDPFAIGGYLMASCGVVFLWLGLHLRHHKVVNPPRWLAILEGTTFCYVVLSVAAFLQVSSWSGLIRAFSTPSGRRLIPVGNSSVGAGLVISAVAVVLAVSATIFCISELSDWVRSAARDRVEGWTQDLNRWAKSQHDSAAETNRSDYYSGVLLAIRDSQNRTNREADESEPEMSKGYSEARDLLDKVRAFGDAPQGRFSDLLSWSNYTLSPRKD